MEGRGWGGGCYERAGAPISWVTVTRNRAVVKRNILLLSYPFERIGKLLVGRGLVGTSTAKKMAAPAEGGVHPGIGVLLCHQR